MEAITRRSFVGTATAMAMVGAMGARPGHSVRTAAAEEPTSQVIIAMNTGSEPAAGFDPLMSWGCGEHVHEPLIQSTLVTTNTELEFENDLATSYECSDDGLTWTFRVRTDVTFTDGQPLTARDVAFTVNGVLASPGSEADLSMVDFAEAPDDETCVLHLNRPFNALLYTLAVLGVVPEHAYDAATYGAAPIGSGRYVLEQWDRGQQVILRANPGYYGEAPAMERVVIVFMEEDAAMAAAASGAVDVAFTSAVLADACPDGYELLACKTVDSRGIALPVIPSGSTKSSGTEGLDYEAGNDVTCDLAVRQAINCGVDRQRMIDAVLNGYGTVAYSVGDGLPWSSEDMRVETDAERAKALLEDAGWKIGPDGVRVKDGTRASLRLWYAAGDSARQAMSAEFANQMARIGIEVLPQGASWDDIYPHEFSDLIMWGWGSNAPIEMYELNYSGGWGNYACYESEKVDAYLEQALAQPDVRDSYEYWKAAQWDGSEGVAPQGAATWVWFANVDHLYFKRAGLSVASQKPHPHGHGWALVNNVDRWGWEG